MIKNIYLKISPKTRKKILEIEEKYILYLGEIMKEYGVIFALKLVKLATKCKKNRPETKKVEIIYPPKIKKLVSGKSDQFNKEFDLYVHRLQDAGFRICKSYEPFVDEDTEKIYTIKRHYIYFINN